MFCPHCGTKNPDDAKYCASCGKALNSTNVSTGLSNDNQTHQEPTYTPPSSYNELGGWLAVLTYGLLVAVILIVIGAVMVGFTLIQVARYLGVWVLFLGLIAIAAYIPVVYFCFKMYRMIKARDCMFLRFYEMTMLLLAGAHIVLMLIGAMSGFISFGDQFKSLLETVIIFAIWMTYFTKSVRVRTYFGSNDYLNQSIILNLIKGHINW